MRACLLYSDPGVTLARYDHPPGVAHRDPAREEAAAYSISFIESGSFDLHVGRRSWTLSRGAVFVTGPGFRYRCAHSSERPDDVCLSLTCSPELVGEMEESAGRTWNGVMPAAPLTNRLAYLHRRLLGASGSDAAAGEVHAIAREVVAAVIGRAAGDVRLHRQNQLAWYADHVDAARRVIERRFAEPLSIDDLGREAGLSPFHFCRLFHELVGEPPHRYLVRVRLAHAAVALTRGAGVTAACHDSGFGNLSHFIRRFRRAYGVSPSRYAGTAWK